MLPKFIQLKPNIKNVFKNNGSRVIGWWENPGVDKDVK